MRKSAGCFVLPVLYLSVAVDFHLVLGVDSRERREKYPPYFSEFFTAVVWVTLTLSSAFYVLSYVTDPGFVHSLSQAEDPAALRCRVCTTPKLPRSHHCSQCQRCVLAMDHHCDFIANCVGLRNRKFFVLFLTYTVPGGLLYVYLACMYAIGRVDGEKLPGLVQGTVLQACFAVSQVMQCVLILLVTSLAFTQWLLVFTNLSSLDMMEIVSTGRPVCCIPTEDEIDMGFVGNLRQVFGRSFHWWALPCAPDLPEPCIFTPVGYLEPTVPYLTGKQSVYEVEKTV